MKVAFITDKLLSGGKERRLVSIVQGLKARKRIRPILILWDGKSADDAVFYKYILETDIPIYYLGRNGRLKNIKVIYDILKNEKVDAISTWAPPVYSYCLIYAQIRLGIPVYNSSITGGSDRYSRKQRFIAHNLHHISRIVNSNSECALNVFRIPKSKRKIIYNGFDFARISCLQDSETIRKKFDIDTEYIVSMAARYSNAKDWPTHIKAASLILDKGYDVTFLCMGDGDASPYEAAVPEVHKNRIKFIGCQKDVESILAASDIVTLATFGEGISNSILEGMAVAKPIVATNCGGNPEIVENGKSGFLTKICDPFEYAECIITLLKDEGLRKTMGERGLSIVNEKFNFEQMISGFENMFLNM